LGRKRHESRRGTAIKEEGVWRREKVDKKETWE
jgi:hypothetical protein